LDNTCAESKQQKMVETSSTTDLVQAELNLSKAKSYTHTEFVNPVDTSFVEQETTVLDFLDVRELSCCPMNSVPKKLMRFHKMKI
jgi:hypothetical protein